MYGTDKRIKICLKKSQMWLQVPPVLVGADRKIPGVHWPDSLAKSVSPRPMTHCVSKKQGARLLGNNTLGFHTHTYTYAHTIKVRGGLQWKYLNSNRL